MARRVDPLHMLFVPHCVRTEINLTSPCAFLCLSSLDGSDVGSLSVMAWVNDECNNLADFNSPTNVTPTREVSTCFSTVYLAFACNLVSYCDEVMLY